MRIPILASLALLAACGAPDPVTAEAAARRFPVEVATATAEPEVRAITAPGSVEARETVHLTARVAGIIERVLVDEGDRVEAGQTVAEIEPERFRIAMASAEARLARTLAARDDAASQQRRREQAATAQPGLISDDELAQLRSRTAQAEAEVAAAEAELSRARLDLRDSRVASPVAGVVQRRLAETGSAVQAGTAIATVVDRSLVRVRCHVPLSDAALLRPGLPLRFRVPGDATERSASIVLVGDAADPGSRLVPVLAQAAPADAQAVRPGSYADIRIDLPPGPERVLVPDLAVRPSSRGFLAYAVAGDGQAATVREHVVTTAGRTRDGRIAIASGLEAGVRIVSRGAEALRDGAPVEIRPAP